MTYIADCRKQARGYQRPREQDQLTRHESPVAISQTIVYTTWDDIYVCSKSVRIMPKLCICLQNQSDPHGPFALILHMDIFVGRS